MQYFVSASYNMLGMNGGILVNKVHPKRIYHTYRSEAIMAVSLQSFRDDAIDV